MPRLSFASATLAGIIIAGNAFGARAAPYDRIDPFAPENSYPGMAQAIKQAAAFERAHPGRRCIFKVVIDGRLRPAQPVCPGPGVQ